MGQKVNPIGFRIGHRIGWENYVNIKEKANYNEIEKIKELITVDLETKEYIVGKINILMSPKEIEIWVDVGIKEQKKQEIEKDWCEEIKRIKKVMQETKMITPEMKIRGTIRPREIKEFDTTLMCRWLGKELGKGVASKSVLQLVNDWYEENRYKGIKVEIKGRVDGVEMANKSWYTRGKLPLQTVKEKIDYAEGRGYSTWGIIGIKIWILK